MKEYPRDFLDRMQKILGDDFSAYMESLAESPARGLHLNLLKTDESELCRFLAGQVTPIPWISGGFFPSEDCRPSENPLYHAGVYYIQEPSAQTPADRLPVSSGDRVLDLCAAPGGKSLQLAGKLAGEGLLAANDYSAGRAAVLVRNLELGGVRNFFVTAESPEMLAAAYPAYFDKILVDAPCSGEGMFRKDPDALKSWQKKGPESYAPVQKQILASAAVMLKPGGLLMYSTCTFSPAEDEEVVLDFLEKHPDFTPAAMEGGDGFAAGLCGLSEAVRLYPHALQGEGHFLCLLRKGGEAENRKEKEPSPSPAKLPEEAVSFLRQTPFKDCLDRVILHNDRLLLLPAGFAPKKGLRYLRTGLFLGTVKKDRFTPSQALAYTLRAEDWPASLRLSPEDPMLIRYLKGETLTGIDAFSGFDGWILVCAGDFGCGWGKIFSGNLKNKLDPTRRIM